MEESGQRDGATSIAYVKLQIHAMYLITGLVIAIIFLATGMWTPQPKFTEYLSNAATFVSVVLGLVAIFYSFVSNDSLSKSLGSITNVTEQIGQTREQMAAYVERTSDITKTASEGSTIMRAASTDMKESFTQLNNILETVQSQTNEFKQMLGQLPERFDKLETAIQLQKETGVKKQPHISTSTAIPDDIVRNFINRSSVVTNLLCYGLVLAKRANKNFSLEEFCNAIEFRAITQVLGILITVDAVEIIDTTSTETKNCFEISYLHPVLNDLIQQYIKQYVAEQFATSPDRLEFWNRRIAAVEAIYAPKTLE